MIDGLATLFAFLGDTGVTRWVIIGAVLFGLWQGLARTRLTSTERMQTWFAVAIPLVAWSILIWRLALVGVFSAQGSPAIPLAIFVPLLVGLLLIMRSHRIASVVDAMPASWLVGLQVYRVFGATFLIQLALGKLAAAFDLPAGTGDFLIGLLALPAAFYLNRDENRGRAVAAAWNALGILDLIVAITMGFLSSTGRLQALGLGAGAGPLSYPLVMVPAFAVPLSLILHAVSLWQLARRGAKVRGGVAAAAGGAV